MAASLTTSRSPARSSSGRCSTRRSRDAARCRGRRGAGRSASGCSRGQRAGFMRPPGARLRGGCPRERSRRAPPGPTRRAATVSGRASVARSASGMASRVHLRVHLAGVHVEEADASALELGGPDAAQVLQRHLRDAVRAPARVGGHGRVRGEVHHHAPAAQRHGPGHGLGEPEGPHEVHLQHLRESSHAVSSSRGSGVGPSVLALWTSTSMGPTSAEAAPTRDRWPPCPPRHRRAREPHAPERAAGGHGLHLRALRDTPTTRAPLRARSFMRASPSPRLAPSPALPCLRASSCLLLCPEVYTGGADPLARLPMYWQNVLA